MPKVTVTLEFSDMNAAIAYFGNPGIGVSQTGAVGAQETPTVIPSGGSTQAPALPTLAEIQQALSDFIKKGEGRTASVAKAIMVEFGVTTIKECPDDKKVALLHAFQTR